MNSARVFPRPPNGRSNRVSRGIPDSSFSGNSGSRSAVDMMEDSDLCYACTGLDQSFIPNRRGLSSVKTSSLGSSSQAKRFRRRVVNDRWIFGKVLDPRSRGIQRMNRLFLLSCTLGIALDPLFLSVYSINSELSCLFVQKGCLITVTFLRSIVDFMYLIQIWLQLKTAYVSKESLVLGRGELVWDARKVALHYLVPLTGFLFDVYIILPVPQVMLWVFTPRLIQYGGETTATEIVTTIIVTFLVQYLPKVLHVALVVRRLQHVTGYIFGTASSGFFLNLITYFVAAHWGGTEACNLPYMVKLDNSTNRDTFPNSVAGSFWYLLTIERVEQCLTIQCENMTNCSPTDVGCPLPIAFSNQPLDDPRRLDFSQNAGVQGCLSGTSNFTFGIYAWGVPLVTDRRFIQKILYPLFWGLMTFSSFGNALVPSDHVVEVAFSIIVITCGLLLFTGLIGNIQVFLHSISAKKEEMQLRIRDQEWWMRRRQLPTRLRLRVRQYERHRWAATRGIDEESLVMDLPEGLRRDIKRHLCLDLVRKVPLFEQLDDLVLNNICDRLKPILFVKGEPIISEGNPVRQMVFIVRGHVQSMYRHPGNQTSCVLGPRSFFGDELVTWCLDKQSSRLPPSLVTLTTLDTTEAFALKAEDLQYITDLFRGKMENEQFSKSVRYHSTRWRVWAAVTIQLAWRRYKASRSPENSGPLHFPQPCATLNASCRDSARRKSQEDRLRVYTAMFISPKPQDHLQ